MRTACVYLMFAFLLCTVRQSAIRAQTVSLTPSVSDMRELHTSFNTLFQAMKEGNVAVIEQYSSGSMSAEYKKLLEQNQDYPAFLRNFYKGATFSIASVTPTSDGNMIVGVVIQLGGGSRSVTKLNVRRFDGSPAMWKVTGVVKDERTTVPSE